MLLYKNHKEPGSTIILQNIIQLIWNILQKPYTINLKRPTDLTHFYRET